jgi:dimethylargininase
LSLVALRALTRPVPDSIQRCELTYIARDDIDLARARVQHAAYEHVLDQLGCLVESVAAAMDLPDSVFIEDTAVVFDEIAVIARPGSPSRQRETDAVAASLARYRRLAAISAPATLDGGDVLRVGRDVYVGVSGRSNGEGVRQLTGLISPYGYRVHAVETQGCLHLKSAVTSTRDDLLIVNPQWIDPRWFPGLQWITVDPEEPFAANVLRVGDTVVCAAAAPRTRGRLEGCGLDVRAVDVSELAKAEGALTCCCLLVA